MILMIPWFHGTCICSVSASLGGAGGRGGAAVN